MQITTDNLFLAYLKSRTLHEHLLTADTLLRYTHGKVPPDSPVSSAKADLRELADAMGFDLVERAPLTAMSKETFMDKINAATKTIPVSDLLHDEPGVQVDGSTTMGFR